MFISRFRIQELEYESIQLDRSFRDYLERQKLAKSSSKQTAESIWNTYNLDKSMLEKKCAAMRVPKQLESIEDEENIIQKNIEEIPTNYESTEVDKVETFQNAFRIAQEKVLAKRKTATQYSTLSLEIHSAESLRQINNEQKLTKISSPEHDIEEMNIQSSNTFIHNELISATSDILLEYLPTKKLQHNPIKRNSSAITCTKQIEAAKKQEGIPKAYSKFKRQLFPSSCGNEENSLKTNDKAKLSLLEEKIVATDVNNLTPTRTDTAIAVAQSLEKINALFSPLKLCSNSSSSSDSSLSINSTNEIRPMPIGCSAVGILQKPTKKETKENGNEILSTEFENSNEQQHESKKIPKEVTHKDKDQQSPELLLEIETIDKELLLSPLSDQELHLKTTCDYSDLKRLTDAIEGIGDSESVTSESMQLSTGKERQGLECSSGSDFWK